MDRKDQSEPPLDLMAQLHLSPATATSPVTDLLPEFAMRPVNALKPRCSMHEFFIQQAVSWSTRSTCAKWQVGCVLVHQGRVISTGYNGSVPGAQHCVDHWNEHWHDHCDALSESDLLSGVDNLLSYLDTEDFRYRHRAWSRKNEVHAEQNAILFAAKVGHATDGCTLYTSLSPCIDCSKSIVAAGIQAVYFNLRKDEEALNFLTKHGVSVYHVSASPQESS